MATAQAPNPRASLLAGLRTGGVRSASGPMGNAPHTAAPGGSFNVPRFASSNFNNSPYPAEDEEDGLSDMMSQNLYINGVPMHQAPLTAAVDGGNNRFSQQQVPQHQANYQRGMMGGVQHNNSLQAQAQQQAIQIQMMQLEMLKLQALQAQQYQAELIAQAQRQQQNQRSYKPPASAAPTTASFDLRSATLNAQMRRASQADALRAQLGVGGDDQVPMTAALGGKFGSRALFPGVAEDNYLTPPATPSHTTVISGGTPLGSPVSSNFNGNVSGNTNGNGNVGPSKSDSAVSWRRGGNNNSVLSGNRGASLGTPNVRITPPPPESKSPSPPSTSPIRTRPQPLRFTTELSQSLPTVAIDDTDADDNSSDGASSKSGGSRSSPTTPHSPTSSNEAPLSAREEATKKL
ncbi:hypothetical protein EWM64_g3739, partial [Hericium alpestre]